MSSAPSDVHFPFFGIVKFSLSPIRHSRASLPHHSHREECVHRVQQVQIFDFHWHEHAVALRVCCPVSLRLTGSSANVAGWLSRRGLRRHPLLHGSGPLVFLCASHLCSSSKPLVSFLCSAFLRLPQISLWVPPSHRQILLVLLERERKVRLQEGCPLLSTSVSVVFRQLLECFTSDQLCSASRPTLRAYATPSTVPTRCSSATSLLPGHPRGFPRFFSHSGKVGKQAQIHQIPATFQKTDHPWLDRTWPTHRSPEAKNEPSCTSNSPCHQCTVSGWSALRAVLKCCEHGAHLSLKRFLISFPLLR